MLTITTPQTLRFSPRGECETRVTGNEAQIFMERERCVNSRQSVEGYVDIRSCRDIGGLFPLYDVKPETTTR